MEVVYRREGVNIPFHNCIMEFVAIILYSAIPLFTIFVFLLIPFDAWHYDYFE